MITRNRAGRPIPSKMAQPIDVSPIWEFMARELAKRKTKPELQQLRDAQPMEQVSDFLVGGAPNDFVTEPDDQAIIDWLAKRYGSPF